MVNDKRLEAAVLYDEALARREQGNPSGAFPRYLRVLEIARELGDLPWQAQVASELGEMYRGTCELMDARRWHEEALGLYRALGDAAQEAMMVLHLAEVAHLAGDMAKAEELFRDALHMQIALGSSLQEGVARARLGRLLWDCRVEDAGMIELVQGWRLLREHAPEDAEALCLRIRSLRDRAGRVRYKRLVEGATDDPALRAQLIV